MCKCPSSNSSTVGPGLKQEGSGRSGVEQKKSLWKKTLERWRRVGLRLRTLARRWSATDAWLMKVELGTPMGDSTLAKS